MEDSERESSSVCENGVCVDINLISLKMIYEKIDFEYAVFMTENNFNIAFKSLENYLKENAYLENQFLQM